MARVAQSDAGRWRELAERASSLIVRASQQQRVQARIGELSQEVRRLSNLYDVPRKKPDWRDYGDLALHLAAAYPPDLAYVIIYGFRELVSGSDPVPLIMMALEKLYYLRPDQLILQLDASAATHDLCRSAAARAERAMRILAREVSTTPYPYATGICDRFDPRIKPFLFQALLQFNPEGAPMLSKGPKAWMRTGVGVKRLLWRVLFGQH